MGEFLPFQRSRLDSRSAASATTTTLKRLPSRYLDTNIVFTNSGVFSPAVMLGAVLEVGADAMMFFVDYPYESSHEAVQGFERATLSAADREKIAHGNAEQLLRISYAAVAGRLEGRLWGPRGSTPARRQHPLPALSQQG